MADVGSSADFDRVGVRAVVEGLREYIQGMRQIEQANKSAGASAQTLARNTGSLTGAAQQGTVAIARFGAAAAGLRFGAAFLGIQSASALLGDFVGDTVNAFITFESSFAGIRKTAELTEEQFKQLERANRNLALSIPVTVNELNKFGSIAGQAGVKGVENIQKFEETIARLGVAIDGIHPEQAALLLTQFMASMREPTENVDRLGATLVALGNALEANEGPILEFAQRIGGAGKLARLSSAEVFGIAGAFASVGVEAEAGGTGVQKVLFAITEAVTEGGDELQLFANIAGQTVKQFVDTWRTDPAAAFKSFVTGIAQSGEQAIKIFDALGINDERLVRAFITLGNAGTKLGDSLDIATGAFAKNNALVDESNKRFETTESKLQLAKNRINETAIDLGEKLAPALVVVFQGLALFIEGISAAIDHLDLIIAALSVLALGLGLVMLPLTALGVAILILSGKWEDVFSQMPRPVQNLAIVVAEAFDAITGVVSAAIDKLADGVQQLIDLVNKAIEAYNKIPLAPNIGTIGDIGGVDLGTGISDTLRRVQIEADIRALGAGAVDSNQAERLTDEFYAMRDAANSAAIATRKIDIPPGLLGKAKEAKEEISAIAGFLEEIVKIQSLDRLIKRFGEIGGKALNALVTAMREDARGPEGKAAADAVGTLLEEMRNEGVPGAEALGQELATAFATGITSGDISSAQGVIDKIVGVLTGMKAATEKALDDIHRIIARAAEVTGDEGDQLASALGTAITEGTQQAVDDFEIELDRFTKAADKIGVKTGDALTRALAAAIRDGTPEAVQAAIDAISAVDAAMAERIRAVEDVDKLGEALTQSLRDQAQEQYDAQREALDAQAEAVRITSQSQIESARDAADAAIDALRDQEDAAQEAYRAQAEAARDSASAQIDAAREASSKYQDAIDADIDFQIEAVGAAKDAREKALDDEEDALKKQQKAEREERKKTSDDAIAGIDAVLQAKLDAIDAELALLDDQDTEDRRIRLLRNLALAYDNDKRFDAEQDIRQLDRDVRRTALRREADDLRNASKAQIDRIRDQIDEEETLRDDALDTRLEQIKIEKDALQDSTEAQIKALRKQRDAAIDAAKAAAKAQIDAMEASRDATLASLAQQEKATAASYQARIQAAESERDGRIKALEAARDSALANLKIEQDAAAAAFKAQTSAYALEGAARKLIEEGNQQAIIDLIHRYYPQWATAGLSLGQQLVLGMKNSGIEEFLNGLLAKITTVRGATGGGAPPPAAPPGAPPRTLPFRGNDVPDYRPPVFDNPLGTLVSSPTMGLLAQNGVPEYVVPYPRMQSLLGGRGDVTIDMSGSQFTGTPQENKQNFRQVVEDIFEEEFTRGAFISGVNR